MVFLVSRSCNKKYVVVPHTFIRNHSRARTIYCYCSCETSYSMFRVTVYKPMSILAWIILGAIAGWLASLIMKTNKSQGFIMNIVVGIVGAVLGGVLFDVFGASGVTGFNLYSLLVAVVGSVVLLWIASLFAKREA